MCLKFKNFCSFRIFILSFVSNQPQFNEVKKLYISNLDCAFLWKRGWNLTSVPMHKNKEICLNYCDKLTYFSNNKQMNLYSSLVSLNKSYQHTITTTSQLQKANKLTLTTQELFLVCLKEDKMRRKGGVEGGAPFFPVIHSHNRVELLEDCMSVYLAWICTEAHSWRSAPGGWPETRSPRSWPSSTAPCGLKTRTDQPKGQSKRIYLLDGKLMTTFCPVEPISHRILRIQFDLLM